MILHNRSFDKQRAIPRTPSISFIKANPLILSKTYSSDFYRYEDVVDFQILLSSFKFP